MTNMVWFDRLYLSLHSLIEFYEPYHALIQFSNDVFILGFHMFVVASYYLLYIRILETISIWNVTRYFFNIAKENYYYFLYVQHVLLKQTLLNFHNII